MKSNLSYHYFPNNILYKEAVLSLIEMIKKNEERKLKSLILLSGGSVINSYPYLLDYLKENPGLSKYMAFAQVDERFQPHGDEKNVNAEEIRKTGLWEVCEKYGIPYFLVSQEKTLTSAANRYNQLLTKLFCEYDRKIAVLGIGADGHTAGLLPGYSVFWNKESGKSSVPNFSDSHGFTRNPKFFGKVSDHKTFGPGQHLVRSFKIGTFGFRNKGRKIVCQLLSSVFKKGTFGFTEKVDVPFPKKKYVIGYENRGIFPQRISITPYAINQLDRAYVLVSGEEKKDILVQFISNENSSCLNDFPTGILYDVPQVEVFSDQVMSSS